MVSLIAGRFLSAQSIVALNENIYIQGVNVYFNYANQSESQFLGIKLLDNDRRILTSKYFISDDFGVNNFFKIPHYVDDGIYYLFFYDSK